jgi:acyl carrier protein
MQREQIRDVLKSIFDDEIGNPSGPLRDEMRVIEEFGLDSVDVVSLIMRVEQHFRIRITQAELAEMGTVGALVDLVQAKVAAQSAGGDSAGSSAANAAA